MIFISIFDCYLINYLELKLQVKCYCKLKSIQVWNNLTINSIMDKNAKNKKINS